MMTSWPGPKEFFITPSTSTGTGSAVLPLKTVQAVAFMPGLTSSSFRISTGPALGGSSSPAVWAASGLAARRPRNRSERRGRTWDWLGNNLGLRKIIGHQGLRF